MPRASEIKRGFVEVMVPDYVTPGERIRVSTDTGEFMGRV